MMETEIVETSLSSSMEDSASRDPEEGAQPETPSGYGKDWKKCMGEKLLRQGHDCKECIGEQPLM